MAIQKSVIDRCNLTALLEPGQEDTAEFLALNKVHIIGDELNLFLIENGRRQSNFFLIL